MFFVACQYLRLAILSSVFLVFKTSCARDCLCFFFVWVAVSIKPQSLSITVSKSRCQTLWWHSMQNCAQTQCCVIFISLLFLFWIDFSLLFFFSCDLYFLWFCFIFIFILIETNDYSVAKTISYLSVEFPSIVIIVILWTFCWERCTTK